MSRYRVTCTVTREKNEGIISVGCYSPGNTYYNFSEQEVIDRIESGRDTFYSERPNGHVAELEVDQCNGKKYVKTKPDGELPDNLLSLPKCDEKKFNGSGVARTVVAAASHGDAWRL
jgi:hypothetical protein